MKSRRFNPFLRLCLVTSLAVTFAQTSHAITSTWTGATNGVWDAAGNWLPSGIPGSGDDAIVLGPSNVAGALTLRFTTGVNPSANSINVTNTAATTFATTATANVLLTMGAGGITTGSGAVTIGANNTATGVNMILGAAQTWNVGAGGLTVANSISSAFALTKAGVGTLTYNSGGAGGLSAGLVLNGGSTVLDFVNLGTPTNLVGSGTTLGFGGGSLNVRGKSTGTTSQTFGNVTVNSGGGQILGDKNGGTSTTISLGSITATSSGGSLLLGAGGTNANLPVITTTSGTLTAGIYGGRSVYFNGTANTGYDWATTLSAGPTFTVSGLATGGYTALGTTTGTDTANSRLTAGATFTAGASRSTNSFKFENPATAVTLDLTATGSLTLGSGGILFTGASVAQGPRISNGSLTAGNGSGSYDLILHSFNATAQSIATGIIGTNLALVTTISSNIVNNGANPVTLVKTGPGSLVLSGTNTFTGGIIVNGGNLGFNSAGAINNNAMTFNANATIHTFGGSTTSGGITLNNGSQLLVLNNNSSFTVSGKVTGNGGISVAQGGQGAITLGLTATNNDFTGPIRFEATNNTVAATVNLGSLVDSAAPGMGNITFGASGTSTAHNLGITAAASSPITLSNRQIILAGSNPNQTINNESGQALTINSNLQVTGTIAKNLTLGGAGAGLNTLAGSLGNHPTPTAAGTAIAALRNTAATSSVTLASVEGIAVGSTITGTGIAASTTITAINPSTRVITLSAAATSVVVGTVYTIPNAVNSVSVTKSGAGTWLLSGANTYTGGTGITAGTIRNGSAVTFTNKGGLFMSSTGVFDLGGFNATFTNFSSAATNSITNSSSSTSVSGATATGTPSGAGIYVDALTFSTPGQTFSTAISDGATRKTQLVINNANSGTDKAGFANNTNSFSGGLVLANNATGTRLRLSSLVTGTPFGTGPILIGQTNTDKAQILLDTVTGITLANNIVVNTSLGTDVAATFRIDTTGNILSGNITANSDIGFNVLGSVTASGAISGASGLTKSNAGLLSLNGTNSYLGNTTISGGSLSIATTGSLPGYDTNGRYSVASGATLAVQNTVSDSDIGILLGTTNFLSGANLGFDTSVGNRTYSASLSDTAQGPLGITKLGANILTLSGTNTYTGVTTVLAGGLNIPAVSALPNWNVNGGFSVVSGASLVIPNTISESEVTTILGTTNLAAGATVSFDTSLGDRNYVSAVTDSATGVLNVGKIGANALTLSGINTHTGNTVVSAGTLNITGSITGLVASSNLVFGATPGNTVVNVSGTVDNYRNIVGANVAGSVAVFNQTGGSVTIVPPNSADQTYLANNGGYGMLNITGGTFNTGRFDGVGATNNNTSAAVIYIGGAGATLNQNTGDWFLPIRNNGIMSMTVAPGGSFVRSSAVTAQFVITGLSNTAGTTSYGMLNVAGGTVDTGTRGINFGQSGFTPAGTNTGFVNAAGGTLLLGLNTAVGAAGGTTNAYFNFAGATVKSSAAMTAVIPASTANYIFKSTIFGPITNDNNANTAFNTQIGATSNFSGGMTVDTNGFSTTFSNALLAGSGFGVNQADIGDVSLLAGNSGYIGAPLVTFSNPAASGDVPATGYAVIDAVSGKVTGIVMTNPGVYALNETPTITLTGGGGSIAPFTTAALTTANTSGGLTKIGTGTLTLSGASTYTGATSVNAGILNLTGTLTSAITVANNANLSGEGSTTSSLTFSGTSDLGFDPSTSGAFLTAGSVDATGASVTVAPTVPVTGTGIVILDAPGGIIGTAGGVGNNFIYTGRGSLYISGTQLKIDTAPVSLSWRGNDGTNPTFWDLNTTTNWDVSGTPEKFFTGDAITFDDTAFSYTVDITAANVSPGNVTFNNTAAYTVQGAFGIFGGATVTKSNTGTVVMNSPNGYTGVTTVNAGVLNIRNANALGNVIAGTSVTAGAAVEIQGGITTAAEPLTLNGDGISSNGALRNISDSNTWGAAVTLASASSIGSDSGTLIVPSLAGAFGLTKVGAGTVNITGVTAVTSTTVQAGTLFMGAQTGASTTTTLGAGSGVTLNGSSNLTIRRTNTGAVDLIGAIDGTGSLTLIGDNATTSASGDFSMNNASTYSGGTSITGARANITVSGAALGTGLVTTGANGQAFVQTSGLTLANNFAIGGLGWNEPSGFLGAVRLNGTTLTGDISLTSNARITGAGTSTLSGIISGSFGIDFFEDNAIGTISLSGANTYTGTTTVNSMGSGTTFPNLIVSNNSALGTTAGGTIVVGTGTTGNGSQLTLAAGITVTDETLTLDSTAAGYRASLITASNGTATWDGNVVTAGANTILGFNANGATSSLTVGSSATDTITGTSNLGMRGAGIGTINSSINLGTAGLFKTDAGIWTITSNNNDFTGTPIIAGGILSVSTIADSGTNSALGAGTTITLGQNSTTAGVLQFTGASGGSSNRTINIANGTSGAGTIQNTVVGQTLTLTGNVTSATPANAHSLTLNGAGDGVLSGSISGSPGLALIKGGAGTWTVSGTKTYTGNTTVTGGTLNITGPLTGNTTTSTLALGTTAANTVVNVSDDMTLFALTGANIAGSNAVYNQTAGTVNVYATGVGSSGSFVANIGYGYFNLTGGTFKSNGAFSIGANNAASNAVAYVGGTGVLDWSGTGSQTVGYASAASLTVGPGGSVSRGNSGNTTWLATNSGSSGIFNIAGGSLDLGTAGSLRVNNTASGGTSVMLNLAGGTLTMGIPLAVNGSNSGSMFANYAGGTLKASATLATSPMNVLTSVSTLFGPIDNLGTAQDFTGGLTIDTNGFSMPYGNALVGASGNGVKQSDIAVTGGSGYIGAPLVTFAGGTLAAGGTPASGYAVVTGGVVTEIVITSPGTYTVDPTVILTGGGGSGASVALSALTPNAADNGLTKTGAGTLTLSGANTYAGGTTINAGTLTLGNASALGTGSASVTGGSLDLGGQNVTNAVSIGAAGTLTGSGSTGATTLAGTLTPGGASSGIITMASATVDPTSSIALQLAGVGARGTIYDALTVTGTLALDGTITVSLNGLTPAGGQTFDLIDSTGPIDVTAFNVATDLILPALSGGLTWDTSAFASTGIISIVGGDPYDAWATLTGATGGKSGDTDGDGRNNLLEFATDGNPTSGANDGKIVTKIAAVGGDQVLTLTLPVRAGAVFSPSAGDQVSALVDALYYKIEGDEDLATFASSISEVSGGDATAIQAGLPALSTASWTYRTFRAPGTVTTVPKAFLRAKVSDTP